ncbi:MULTISPECIES: bifunctional ornithine acetyltransferase/N-acetylglutamate synthase [unclassified Oceanispirochaeta]|uniref:bifunctional ornithine acetyltransferase/N-acetylglutamate synthase n=1 Tax=unclassified Oceanispirochaeta TaxID=2635722 RepID=UPI000E097AE6|nr:MULTISPECIES: bifunctional ornithine acetyltransferase/N-acetylglutamate synthase [unclassified Oceanispirochaeta]MBF9017833.1 bifunctional ornithine acetyltransferase/N-acetylglutamate synthase [Oceanispirochaeta sp. M2]NPD74293.1 bifunctional ornithine acetyltransferase/N-acetylglutamate synthase [Oceanispirochaeta sp. M1]RDG29882.1 bifunctional ornithine acetyltransferase/N-acetylglutamate synthase [Oceanispirochaeta sp. M1]
MNRYHSEQQYLEELERNSALPEGFSIAVKSLNFIPEEKKDGPAAAMNMTAIVLDKPTPSFGAVFTKNAFPGAPVRIGRQLLNEETVQGVLINNKISNVCTPNGEDDARAVLSAFAGAMAGTLQAPLFPSSTGVIGWSLPVKAMEDACPDLQSSLQKDSFLPAAKSIMTTDAFPKLRSVSLGTGRISGIAKGAGMIEPNMATMLSFLLTDVSLPREMMRRVLKRVVDQSYNTISIDSDQSTSDSVLFFSSGCLPEVSEKELENALLHLCKTLSEDIVRNGEGCGHVIKVNVERAVSDIQARGFAKALVNSPLSKTAVFGNDPNVGRFIQALGDYAGNNDIELDETAVSLRLGDEVIYSSGRFQLDSEKESRLSDYLKERALPTPCPGYPQHDALVEIFVDLGLGEGRADVMGSDLSYEYVRENADYRT